MRTTDAVVDVAVVVVVAAAASAAVVVTLAVVASLAANDFVAAGSPTVLVNLYFRAVIATQ